MDLAQGQPHVYHFSVVKKISPPTTVFWVTFDDFSDVSNKKKKTLVTILKFR